jgi:hemolysin III
VVCFGIAILARMADPWQLKAFPFGTHFLWHVFGAVAVHLLAAYLCRLDDMLAGETVG